MKNDQTTYAIAILGANGGIGRQAVELALKAGHHVTAILRNPANLTLVHTTLTLVQGDVMKPESLIKHFKNKDVVISAIGKTSLAETVLYSQGNSNVLEAMEASGVNRVFFISASGLAVNPSHSIVVKLATRFILQKILKKMYADLTRMEAIVKKSPLNWTIMRPPKLTNEALTGRYRFSIDHFLKNGLKISRANVAHFMIGNLFNAEIFKTTVEIAD